MTTYNLIQISDRWFVARYENGVFQWTVTCGCKKKESALRIAAIKHINV